MLVDEAEISIKAGRGGDGVVSFRREKYVPKGGPDGGDGGDGGNIYFEVDNNTDTLSHYLTHKQFSAEDGERGKKKKMHGKNGKDLTLKVPMGTILYEIKDNIKTKLVDLTQNKQKVLLARGGEGGLGNDHFKSSTNQTPKEFTKGEKGQRKRLFLELKLIADVGLIGLPNSGKSTLLGTISHAKPKTANYEFTTLIPNLGQVEYDDYKFIVADIPGIIEGASNGKGLGIKFLKHISRTRLDIMIFDITKDIKTQYDTLKSELAKYDRNILDKVKLIVLNKIDLLDKDTINLVLSENHKLFKDKNIITISAKENTNTKELLTHITKSLKKLDK